MATLVARGWAGVAKKAKRDLSVTDRPRDRASCRVACTRLKRLESTKCPRIIAISIKLQCELFHLSLSRAFSSFLLLLPLAQIGNEDKSRKKRGKRTANASSVGTQVEFGDLEIEVTYCLRNDEDSECQFRRHSGRIWRFGDWGDILLEK